MIPDRVKAHFERNKRRYYIVSIVGVAGITLLIMKGRGAGLPESTASRSETVFTRPFFLFSNHNNVVTVIQRMGRGRRGNMTVCLETGENFASQTLAALSEGASNKDMSMHVRGKGLPDINGRHFVRP
jgi:hypothetical protein